jgi:D-alanyl-D-alanine carboxypeptidase
MPFDPCRRHVLRLAGATALAPWLAACGGGGDDSRDAAYGQAVQSFTAAYHPPGVLVGVRVGADAPWMRAFGLADAARAKPMTLDHTFPVRSVTKSFTVTAFLQLVQAGRLGLDDKVERYVAGVPNGNLIALADLAGNQSGLADYSAQTAFVQPFIQNTLRVWTPQELLAFSFAVPPPFPPGGQYQYSNTNTVLLGVVIEKVTAQALGDVLSSQIFQPLGLDATIYPSSAQLPAPTPTGYAVDLDTGESDDQPLISPTSLPAPARSRRSWSICSCGAMHSGAVR